MTQSTVRVIGNLMVGGHFSNQISHKGWYLESETGFFMIWILKQQQAGLKTHMTRWLEPNILEFKTVIKGFGQLACTP